MLSFMILRQEAIMTGNVTFSEDFKRDAVFAGSEDRFTIPCQINRVVCMLVAVRIV